jgi:hypothetical protein
LSRFLPYFERAEPADLDLLASDERIADHSEALVDQAAGVGPWHFV